MLLLIRLFRVETVVFFVLLGRTLRLVLGGRKRGVVKRLQALLLCVLLLLRQTGRYGFFSPFKTSIAAI